MSEELAGKPLSEFAELTMGQSPDSAHINSDERGLPFLQGSAEFGAVHPEHDVYCTQPVRIAKTGSTLISVRAPVGVLNHADRDYCIGRGLGAVFAKNGSNSVFLAHAIEHNADYLHRRSQGSTFLAINTNDLATLPIPAFDPGEQNQIGSVLSAVDDAIAQTEALIVKTQQIKAGLMHDLFTRGVTADGQLRPPREQAPELYKESPLGWIPNDWTVSSVNGLCSSIVDCPHSTPEYVDDGIPCIRTADMVPGELLVEQAYHVSERTYRERSSRMALEPGDVIYSREGERLGIASPVGDVTVCMGQRVMALRPSSETAPSFLMFAMNTERFYRSVVSGLGATTSPHVNVGDIRVKLLPRPHSDEQDLIAVALTKLQHQLQTDGVVLSKLHSFRSGLMHDLLTGCVAVPAT